MEITKPEVAALEHAAKSVEENLQTLDDLDLSLVGGGMGDIIF